MKRKTSSKIPVIVIFAPTASGKTALTREFFSPKGSHFILNAEIISADSQAVYQGMDIGTAKPDSSFQKEIPHHLIDILTPDKQFNVSDWVDAADEKCKDIFSRGLIPVVVGGTGFYIRNFIYGVAKTPVSDEKIRNQLKERIAKEGNEVLYEELKSIDPESAKVIHPNDAYRICRALEVYYICGKTRTSFKIDPTPREQYDFYFIVLEPDRDLLYNRIRERVDQMFNAGLEDEVKNLVSKGYNKYSPGLKAIGYSEWFEDSDDDRIIENPDIETIKENIKHHSCKYAKKQYTYIRDIPGSKIIQFDGTDFSEVNNVFLQIKNDIELKNKELNN